MRRPTGWRAIWSAAASTASDGAAGPRCPCLALAVRRPRVAALARGGSIRVDGASPTVNAADDGVSRSRHALYGHAYCIRWKSWSARLQLEVDSVARYVERLLQARGD
jgi:riboflavin synthase alpha subunit